MSRAALCVTYNLPSGPCAAGTPLTSALPRSPLTGPGKRVCVMSAASVDRPYFRLQAAGPGGGARPQRLSLPDLRGLVQAGQYRRPLAPGGKDPATHLTQPPHTPATLCTCHHGDGALPFLLLSPHGSNFLPVSALACAMELLERSNHAAVNQLLVSRKCSP